MGDRERKGYNPPDISGLITLKVDNIPYRCTEEQLRTAFDRFGDIGDVYCPRDRNSGEPRGFAFVRFVKREDADIALEKMENFDMDGRQLRIQFAMQRRPDNPREHYQARAQMRAPRGGYGGGGGGGYGGYGGGGGYGNRSRSPPRRRNRSRSRSYDRRRSPDRPSRRSPTPERRRDSSRSPLKRRESRSRSRSP